MNRHDGRDRWGSRSAFILAAVGSAVGLGNIWRYPHVAFNAGGGAFLIPYFIALFTAGLPLLLLEYGAGHKMQGSSPATMTKANKKFEFIGWWAPLGALFITFYYAALMGWVCFYIKDLLVTVFTGADKLPWEAVGAGAYLESSGVTGDPDVSKSNSRFDHFNLWGLAFNALVWGFIYFAIRNGVKSVGKVVWVTVLLPYLLLIVLFFTAIKLDGASAGISYYLTPDWTKLDSLEGIANVASAAYGQIFFSLSIGFGIMMAYASFLPRKSDIANNAHITAFANSGTEFFAGFITFAVLGFLALSSGVFVSDQVGSSSFGLALVSYPTAIGEITESTMTNALIGLAFFGSLLFLGVDSAFSLVEACVAGVCDKFKVNRKAMSAGLCVLGFLVGCLYCFPVGLSILDVSDHYLSDYGLLIMGLSQCVILGWVYGAHKIRKHINKVSERRISIFWEICIKYITPPILIFLLIWQIKKEFASNVMYGGYPGWMQAIGIGWLVLGLLVAIILTAKKPTVEGYGEEAEAEDGDE